MHELDVRIAVRQHNYGSLMLNFGVWLAQGRIQEARTSPPASPLCITLMFLAPVQTNFF